MALSASGLVSLPLENLRTLLANSSNFQTMVGAGDADAAKADIHYPAVDEDNYDRPLAVIWAEDQDFPVLSRSDSADFDESGSLSLAIERDISADYQADGSEEDAYLEFTNILGAILADMMNLAGTATYLDVRRIRIEELTRTPMTDETTGTLYYAVLLSIEWGGA